MKTRFIIIITSFILFFGFITYPLAKAVKEERSKQKELGKTIILLNQTLKKVEVSQNQNPGPKKNLEKTFPIKNEQEKIIEDLKSIELQSGFGFKNLSFSKSINQNLGLPELKINFDTQGPRSNLQNFLKLIETNERFLGMETLNIEKNKGQDTVSFSVSLYAFYQNP